MHRLKVKKVVRLIGVLLVLSVMQPACVQKKPVVRDQLTVEKLRLRITKVRNAVAETRAVIAASRGASHLPELYMRLAELLSEEARYHYMVAYEREQRSTKSLHVPQVRFLKEQAISTYNLILKKYPSTHLADRILFNISHEQRELGLFDKMKDSLQRLVKDYPNSSYKAEALLVLGDFYFDRTKFAKAEHYYVEIVKQQRSPLKGLAYYKLAWVYVNISDCQGALRNFEKAIIADRKAFTDFKKKRRAQTRKSKEVQGEFAIPQFDKGKYSFAGHKSVNVQREALVDLTYCYAQERKPEKAVAYLKRLASTRESYVAALAKMANRYALIEQPKGTAQVARELLRLAPDDEQRLDDARMLHNAVVRMKDYSAVGEDVPLILRAMRRQLLKPKLDESAKVLLLKEFELLARDLATKSHQLLMRRGKRGFGGTQWTKNPVSADQTATAYTAYLNVLPESPNRLEMVGNLADVLMDSKRYLEAGHRYRETAFLLSKPVTDAEVEALNAPPKDTEKKKRRRKTKPKPKIDKKTLQQQRTRARVDALYNAAVADQPSLESEHARGHMERATARAGMRMAGGQYLEEGKPDKEKARNIKFAIAQSYYDEGSYLEAIDLLTAIAYEYPKSQQGDAAVHMVLDSYSVINDMSGLINVGRRFLTGGSPVAGRIKSQISPIVQAAEQRRLDELSLAASGDQAGGMAVLLSFADRYQDSELGERAMLSAFVAARAGGDTEQVYALGEQVVNRFPRSNQVSGVVSTMGRTAATRFEFDRSIQYLERAASISPDEKATLLLTAGEIREQLADTRGAEKNYRQALRAAGPGTGRAEAATHLADLIERTGTPKEVVRNLTPLADPPDPEILSRLGLALLRVGKQEEAEEYFRQVTEGAAAASSAAQARASYGMAEIMLHMLETYEPPPEIDAVEELIGIIEVVLQSYLAAARQPDATYSQAALARLARAAEVGAEKLETIVLPADLTEEERDLITVALANRANQLRADSGEALKECARRAKASYLFDGAGKACVKGETPRQDPVQYRPLSPRNKATALAHAESARERLSRNPDDLDALRIVGKAFLDAGDAHAARLVLDRTVEAGGGADDLNLLGVASYKSGDVLGALAAFGRAKDAGSSAAVRNLAVVCKELGLSGFVQEILEGAPAKVDGVLLEKAKSISVLPKRGEK